MNISPQFRVFSRYKFLSNISLTVQCLYIDLLLYRCCLSNRSSGSGGSAVELLYLLERRRTVSVTLRQNTNTVQGCCIFWSAVGQALSQRMNAGRRQQAVGRRQQAGQAGQAGQAISSRQQTVDSRQQTAVGSRKQAWQAAGSGGRLYLESESERRKLGCCLVSVRLEEAKRVEQCMEMEMECFG